MNKLTSVCAVLAFAMALPVFAAGDNDTKTVKGEIVDLACYTDHGAAGEKHQGCGTKCVSSGLPVGIKAEDGKVYMVIGDHKPMNSELAPYVGKVITLNGKLVSRGGLSLLENAEIVK